MALAKNLNKKSRKSVKIKWPKINKNYIWVAVFVAVALGIYGIINLSRVSMFKTEKMEVKFETGDRPLVQKTSLWVTADGGLYMRALAEAKSKIVILIPSGTQLESEEVSGDWYKVTYKNKTGWVNKGFVTTTPPAEDPTKEFKNLIDKTNGFTIKYPIDWVYKNYGANTASNSQVYYGFGLQLSEALSSSALPPIILRVSTKNQEQVKADYVALKATTAVATVSGLPGAKFTYNSSSGILMNAYIVGRGNLTYIIEESGGYENELNLMLKTFVIN